ncbi:MAG: ribosome biogenesis GTPase Der [Planctomycetia bacterium]|nr:ribosome biogenesis GTPase Der [Planctomycetia bacterium]
MGIAKIAIVGRPNVGKSSLFNWLIGERVSIVDSVAGVTRDRVSFLLDIGSSSDQRLRNQSRRSGLDSTGKKQSADQKSEKEHWETEEESCSPRLIELTDTGGIGIVDKDDLSEDVEQQIQWAINSADLILFLVDSRSGIAPLDEYIAERLRKLSVPILLVANKSDDINLERNAEEFQRFGWGVIPVSVKQKRGRVHLMDELEKTIPTSIFDENEGNHSDELIQPVMKIAIVGRRNVGKSTFVNTLAQEERVIASPVPGTTRDSIDVRFEMDGQTFVAIDTPGFIRKKSISNDLDFYSTTRAERGIRMADVVLMFFDASQQISKMDKQLVNLIEKHIRPCIFVVNKWDLMAQHKMPTSRWGDYLRDTFGTMAHVPIAFITGQTGQNAQKLIQHAQRLMRQSRRRVSTNELNKLIIAAMDYNPPPLYYHRKVKVYYATQVSVSPPTIVLFCNMPEAFSPSYQRYLLNVLRDELPFSEVPIRLVFRKRESEDRTDAVDSKRKS